MSAVVSESALRPPLRVGDWLVDPHRLVIQGPDGEHSLEPRVMELLLYLAERPREVISSEQLLIDIWRGTFYGDGPVQRAMAVLRRSLGDSLQSPRYIETIRKRGYRLIADVVLPEGHAGYGAQPTAAWSGGSPFVGLQPFDSAHSDIFFGRARHSAMLLEAMRRQLAHGQRMLLMLGPSGCGKTSLLRAGVLPLITRHGGVDGLHAAAVASADFADARRGDAVSALAAALCRWRLDDRPVFVDADFVDGELRGAPENLVDGIDSAFARRTGKGAASDCLLLLLDHTEAALNGGDAEALNRALAVLCGSPRVLVVMLCRSDFYPALLTQLPVVAELKQPDGHFDLLPPTPGEIAEIIRRPAQAAGLSFEKHPDSLLGLDDVLRDAAVAHPEALPMLQYTLQALYEARGDGFVLGFAAYDALGGLGGALAMRAEQLFQRLGAEEQAAWVPVFERLVVSHESNQALTARRLPWDTLRSGAERDLVHRLVEARLFTSSLSHGTAYFSVTHETLLRAWPRVQAWARDNQRHLQAQQRIQQATRRWLQAGKRGDLLLNHGLPLAEAIDLVEHAPRLLDADDQELVAASAASDRRRRRNRLFAFAAMVLLAVASALSALLAVRAHQDAERRRSQAESLVDYLLTDLADELRPVGRLALMDHIAQRALDYLSRLPERDADEGTRIQRVRALRTLGEVFVDRGNPTAAATAFEQAAALLDAAPTGAAATPTLLVERGTLAYWQGMVAFRQGALDVAAAAFGRYRGYAEELTRREPDNPDWTLELSYALNNLGSVAHQRQRTTEALALFEQSVALKDRVLAARPDNSALAAEQADSLSWLGSALDQNGRLAEAAEYYARQLQVLRGIGTREPSDGWRHRLALAELIMGDLQIALGDLDAARALSDSAEHALAALVAADASNTTWQSNLSFARSQVAYLALLAGDPAAAVAHLERAEQRLRPLLASADAPTEWRRLAVQIALRRAQAAIAQGSPLLADAHLEDALAGARALGAAGTRDRDAEQLLARVLLVQGDLFARRRSDHDAAIAWNEAHALLAAAASDSRDRRVLLPWITINRRLRRDAEVTTFGDRLRAIGYRLSLDAPQ